MIVVVALVVSRLSTLDSKFKDRLILTNVQGIHILIHYKTLGTAIFTNEQHTFVDQLSSCAFWKHRLVPIPHTMVTNSYSRVFFFLSPLQHVPYMWPNGLVARCGVVDMSSEMTRVYC